jgi:integrase
LGRRQRATAPQSLQVKTGSTRLHTFNASSGGSRPKKTPCLNLAAKHITAWAEAKPDKNRDRKLVAQALIAQTRGLETEQIAAQDGNAIVLAWKEKYARNTVHHLRALLANLLRTLCLFGAPETAARLLMRAPGYQPRQTIFTHDEIAAVMAAAPPWLSFLIHVCYTLALRSGDAVNLCPANYDRATKTIRNLKTKGNRALTLPVTDPALIEVLERIGPEDSTVPYAQLIREITPKNPNGGNHRPDWRETFCAETAQNAWNTARRKAAIRPELRMHDLRRTRATELYVKTLDIILCQKILGHASVSTTAFYIAHADNDAALRPILEASYSPFRDAEDIRAAARIGPSKLITQPATRRTQ